ncbi:MAG: universal stress protein [Saprospiraceae bacterium]|nr:universal stress protein [Saprospiraceae bacterium]
MNSTKNPVQQTLTQSPPPLKNSGMKIFCPIDFSEASLNALRYAVQFGKSINAQIIEISHCFTESTDLKHLVVDEESGEDAIQHRLLKLERSYVEEYGVKMGSSLFKGHPLDIIPPYLKQMKHDLVIVGTKGLTAVRDLTVGSFTEDLIFSIPTPIMVIPHHYVFEQMSNIVLAIDDHLFSSSGVLRPLIDLRKNASSTLHIVHVRKPEEEPIDYLHNLDEYLDHTDYNFYSIPVHDSVSDTLDQFCEEHAADILCMVHRDRGWMINIFHRSKVKEKLFHLKAPLLVLQG